MEYSKRHKRHYETHAETVKRLKRLTEVGAGYASPAYYKDWGPFKPHYVRSWKSSCNGAYGFFKRNARRVARRKGWGNGNEYRRLSEFWWILW